ncbi:MAG TPA: Gfo/Idh/MocA family oxidoreductase [Anaerolineales bacterium]
MKRPLLNWGLLSTARINRAIIPPVRASKRSRLLAVGSRTRESAGEYAERWNIPRAHGSYEALLDDPEIDVIYNSLPNHLHAEWTIRALRAGKHVLCEKPIALRMRDVDAIAAAAKETGRIVAEAFMYRHHPVTLKVKEMVDGGEIGQLQYVRGSFSYTLTRESYRAKPEMGGGSLWDVGCYPISYARMLTGEEPVEVFGRQVIGEGGIDVTFVGEMRFPGGVLAQFDSGFHSPLRVQMEAAGSDGWLKVENPYKPGKGEHILFSRGDETQRIRVPGRELYIGEVEDLEDAVLKGAAPRITLEDSRGNIAVIQALMESARTGRPVNVERRE